MPLVAIRFAILAIVVLAVISCKKDRNDTPSRYLLSKKIDSSSGTYEYEYDASGKLMVEEYIPIPSLNHALYRRTFSYDASGRMLEHVTDYGHPSNVDQKLVFEYNVDETIKQTKAYNAETNALLSTTVYAYDRNQASATLYQAAGNYWGKTEVLYASDLKNITTISKFQGTYGMISQADLRTYDANKNPESLLPYGLVDFKPAENNCTTRITTSLGTLVYTDTRSAVEINAAGYPTKQTFTSATISYEYIQR